MSRHASKNLYNSYRHSLHLISLIFVSSLLAPRSSAEVVRVPPFWRPSQSSYFCIEERGARIEETSPRSDERGYTRAAFQEVFYRPTHPLTGYQLIDWTLQLIGLIRHITTSLQFNTGVKIDYRLNWSVSLPSFIFYLLSDSPSSYKSVLTVWTTKELQTTFFIY